MEKNPVNRYALLQDLRSVGFAYLFFFLFWSHYAYVGKWKRQLFTWLLLGACGVVWLLYAIAMGGSLVDSEEGCWICRMYLVLALSLGAGVIFWWWYSLVTLRQLVLCYNRPIEEQLVALDGLAGSGAGAR